MNYRNAQKTESVFAVDCEIDHPEFGWIITTVTKEEQPDFYGQIMAGEVADFVPPPPPGDDARHLSRPQFAFLLALTGFDDVWDALEANFKASDRPQFAALKAERARSRFQLSRTLEIVATFRPVAQGIAPDVDLSDAAIRAAWEQAEQFGVADHE